MTNKLCCATNYPKYLITKRLNLSTILFALLCSCLVLLHSCTATKKEDVDAKKIVYQKTDSEANVAFYNNKPFTGTAYTLHPNKKRFVEKSFTEGIENGSWVVWYDNGKKMKSGTMKNGVKDGTDYFYWDNGKTREKTPYKNNKKNGSAETWHANGKRHTLREWENDVLNGKVMVWDSLGNLMEQYQYKMGQVISRESNNAGKTPPPPMPATPPKGK